MLPRAESEAFWPLYREYERQREQIEQWAWALLEDYLKSARTLDDAATRALLDRLFTLYERRLALLRTYATALQARLPMRQAAEFVQTEFELMRLRDLQRDARLEIMRRGWEEYTNGQNANDPGGQVHRVSQLRACLLDDARAELSTARGARPRLHLGARRLLGPHDVPALQRRAMHPGVHPARDDP
jgi:hypothetical protein